jgi:VanZ family protein
VLLMLTAIFVFSTDSFSSDQTSRIIVPILKFLAPGLSAIQVEFWHHVVRKAGHITEYCILGGLIYRALRMDVTSLAILRVATVASIAAVALFDEFHQSFVPSRTSSIIDVGYDCIGGMMAILLLWAWRATGPRATEQ